jgi:uncharacterized protein YehS (DUF1456 family)
MEQYQLENILVSLNRVAFTTDQLHKALLLNDFKLTKAELEALLQKFFGYYAVKSAKYYWRTGDEAKTISANQLNKLIKETV